MGSVHCTCNRFTYMEFVLVVITYMKPFVTYITIYNIIVNIYDQCIIYVGIHAQHA
jgi:hypothetical protein